MHGCCLLELSHNRWCRHNNSSHKCASVVLRDDVYATRPMLQKGSHNTTSVTKVRKTLGREIMSDSKAQNPMDLLKRSAGRRVARPKEFARDWGEMDLLMKTSRTPVHCHGPTNGSIRSPSTSALWPLYYYYFTCCQPNPNPSGVPSKFDNLLSPIILDNCSCVSTEHKYYPHAYVFFSRDPHAYVAILSID